MQQMHEMISVLSFPTRVDAAPHFFMASDAGETEKLRRNTSVSGNTLRSLLHGMLKKLIKICK